MAATSRPHSVPPPPRFERPLPQLAPSRAAANAVSGQAIIDGSTAIDSGRAVTAANNYLSAAGVGGTVAVSGNRITVVVTTDYSPAFIPLAFPIEATATAELITQ